MGPVDLDPRTWDGLEYLESISGPGAIAEVVRSFAQDAPARIERMKVALAAEDRVGLVRQAHDLKSNSATVGALELSTLAARIEREAGERPSGDLRAWIDHAESMLPELFRALDDKLQRYPG